MNIGSSPLARGLLLFVWLCLVVFGDHPRSRGVYWVHPGTRTTRSGSSPLARGLPPRTSRPMTPSRIIPARAGFTGPWPRGRWRAGDHPRSRGVYEAVARCRWGWGGSSPLARGLPRGPGRRAVSLRIIPARAGFTRDGPLGARPSWDHPRSRGVYSAGQSLDCQPPGSSPLARGLREPLLTGLHKRRIIPARAGFTHAMSPA